MAMKRFVKKNNTVIELRDVLVSKNIKMTPMQQWLYNQNTDCKTIQLLEDRIQLEDQAKRVIEHNELKRIEAELIEEAGTSQTMPQEIVKSYVAQESKLFIGAHDIKVEFNEVLTASDILTLSGAVAYKIKETPEGTVFIDLTADIDVDIQGEDIVLSVTQENKTASVVVNYVEESIAV